VREGLARAFCSPFQCLARLSSPLPCRHLPVALQVWDFRAKGATGAAGDLGLPPQRAVPGCKDNTHIAASASSKVCEQAQARNPRTGEAIEVKATTVPTFTAGKLLACKATAIGPVHQLHAASVCASGC